MSFSLRNQRSLTRLAILPSLLALVSLAGCGTSVNHPKLGRAETLYKSLGGPDFVGEDGGAKTKIVFDWFDAHYDQLDKFSGKDGVCTGYEPAGEMVQRERTVCAGAAHAWLSKEMKNERTR